MFFSGEFQLTEKRRKRDKEKKTFLFRFSKKGLGAKYPNVCWFSAQKKLISVQSLLIKAQ
jgi:hypothetical protein